MHILFLTDNFPPEVNAPASRTFEHCRQWVRAGAQVTVITCAPNFPQGKVYDGYRNLIWQREKIDGISVIRVWTFISANEGFFKRIIDYVSFMISAIFAAIFVKKVDIIVGTSPQFFTVCAAYCVALFKRRPWVFELRDIWPESIRAVGAMRGARLLDILERVELFLYRKADAIVAVTHAFKSSLVRRGVDGDKIDVVTNGADLSRFSPREKDAQLVEKHGLSDKFVAGYVGTHGMAHALDTLLDVAKFLKQSADGDRYRILLVGHGATKARLIERARNESLDNVVFVDSVSKQDVVRYWSILDVSIIHLRQTDLFNSVIPSKLFECMAMGLPVLHGVEGESADLVRKDGVGLCFQPENPTSLLAGIRRISEDRELRARFRVNGPIAAQKYDRSMLALNMLRVLNKVGVP